MASEWQAVTSDIEQKKVIPLYFDAYSQQALNFRSKNPQFPRSLIFKYVGNQGIHAIDRGGNNCIMKGMGHYRISTKMLLTQS